MCYTPLILYIGDRADGDVDSGRDREWQLLDRALVDAVNCNALHLYTKYVLLLVLLLSFLVVSADVDTDRLIEREKLSSS